MNTKGYKTAMKLLKKITDNLINLSNNYLVDFGDDNDKVNEIYNIGNGNFNNNSNIVFSTKEK